MKRLIAWIFRKRLVVLEDFQGELYLVFERKDLLGRRYARVFDFTNTGHVFLNDDGSCKGESLYIKTWSNYK